MPRRRTPATNDNLFPELPAPATKTPGKSVTKREPKEASPLTPQGQNAGDILKQWIDWYTRCNNGVPIPQTIIARIGKQIRGLIVSGYTTDDIKYGLAIWTVRQSVDPRLSPTNLDGITWEWASKTRGNVTAWREATIRQIGEFSNGAVSATERPRTREERHHANSDTIDQWVSQEGPR